MSINTNILIIFAVYELIRFFIKASALIKKSGNAKTRSEMSYYKKSLIMRFLMLFVYAVIDLCAYELLIWIGAQFGIMAANHLVYVIITIILNLIFTER